MLLLAYCAERSSVNRESRITKSHLSFSFALSPGIVVNMLQSATHNCATVTASMDTLFHKVCCKKGSGRDIFTCYSKVV